MSAYSLAELFAEKTRALYERTRPRDLYDVVFLLANRAEAIDFDHARELFQKKCRLKRFEPPSAATVVALARESPELRTEWANMLAHQLPQLPPIESMLGPWMISSVGSTRPSCFRSLSCQLRQADPARNWSRRRASLCGARVYPSKSSASRARIA